MISALQRKICSSHTRKYHLMSNNSSAFVIHHHKLFNIHEAICKICRLVDFTYILFTFHIDHTIVCSLKLRIILKVKTFSCITTFNFKIFRSHVLSIFDTRSKLSNIPKINHTLISRDTPTHRLLHTRRRTTRDRNSRENYSLS